MRASGQDRSFDDLAHRAVEAEKIPVSASRNRTALHGCPHAGSDDMGHLKLMDSAGTPQPAAIDLVAVPDIERVRQVSRDRLGEEQHIIGHIDDAALSLAQVFEGCGFAKRAQLETLQRIPFANHTHRCDIQRAVAAAGCEDRLENH